MLILRHVQDRARRRDRRLRHHEPGGRGEGQGGRPLDLPRQRLAVGQFHQQPVEPLVALDIRGEILVRHAAAHQAVDVGHHLAQTPRAPAAWRPARPRAVPPAPPACRAARSRRRSRARRRRGWRSRPRGSPPAAPPPSSRAQRRAHRRAGDAEPLDRRELRQPRPGGQLAAQDQRPQPQQGPWWSATSPPPPGPAAPACSARDHAVDQRRRPHRPRVDVEVVEHVVGVGVDRALLRLHDQPRPRGTRG